MSIWLNTLWSHFWRIFERTLNEWLRDMLDTLWITLWKKPLCKPLGTSWSHWWAHCERTQHVLAENIVIPSLGTLWMWSPCPHWAHCDQIDGDIVNVITMYPLGTLEPHGWVHFKCDQHLPTGYITSTWLGTFWMYLIFAHWTHCDHLLTKFSMYSACAHWLLGPLPPVSVPSGIEWRRHGLLIHDEIGHHSLNPGNPLFQLSLLGFQAIPLEQC